ncbi:putative uncharacterized protein DDB_G0271606 [Mercenaria mercenaria]|uniref:putative uncharacterized protein DDB_G0271606 n=1 Tax=Mercenaria mercenaria TaxID=6596 RepID=UPI00234FA264|nr:putative uncharacterized protein DDB_G0271606 [Mercenaria mercenaria]
MEKRIGICSMFQLKVLCITAIWLSGTFSNAYHVDNVSQKANAKLVNNNSKVAETQPNLGIYQSSLDGISATKNKSVRPQKSLSQLQIEITELLRMQKQLKSEIVPGTDTAKQTELLQHIKTQIHLRRMQQKRKQQQQQAGSTKQAQLLQQKKQQLILQQRNVVKQQREQALQSVSHVRQKKQNQLITHKQHQQKQHNSQGFQGDRKRLMTVYNSNNNGIANNNVVQVIETVPEQTLMYKNVDVNGNLKPQRQQQQLQAQMMSRPAFVQKKTPIQLNNPTGINQGQINLLDQQKLMNQTVLQAGSPQHIFIPLNAIALNNMVPKNVLSGERFIVIDAAIQDNGQMKTVGNSRVIDPAEPKSPQKLTTAPPTTTPQIQQITRTTTTPSPSTTRTTTVPTTPLPTFAPTPPPESFVYEPAAIETETLKQEYYRGKIQRQKLEITKLKLEIRDLQRKEMVSMTRGMSRGEAGDDDAPPRRNMMRMPFRFF